MDEKRQTANPGVPDGPSLPPGSRIGRYDVIGLLGRGGMGVVYRANDSRLQREVAIKVLHEKDPVPGMRERLLREARAVSAINHPSICTLFDIGEQDGDPYLVMELLQGESLRDRMRKKPLSPAEVVEYSLQIADALAEAHGNAIIHRDIKPANIFLCQKASGSIQVKVLDFGLAKRRSDIDDSANLTGPGMTIGTIAYMSPEQARGEPLDARTDLFSFGAVMYEMATSRLPFSGQTSAMVFVELLERDPRPVRELNRLMPARLEAVINKALSKEFADRYQSAVAIHTDLEAVWAEILVPPAAVFPPVAGVMPGAGSGASPSPIVNPVRMPEYPGAMPSEPRPSASREIPTVYTHSSGTGEVRDSQSSTARSRAVGDSGSARLMEPQRSSQGKMAATGAASPATEAGRIKAAEKAKAAAEEKRQRRNKMRLGYLTMVLIVAVIAAGIYIQFGHTVASVGLHQGDTIMVGKIENKTESPKLDHSFRVGLAIDLEQSPYVNVVLGPDGAASVAGSKAALTGQISSQAPFVIDVKLNGPDGKLIAETQDTAQELENVPETIDRVALDLRRQMGEPQASRDSYSRLLHQEATSSLDALEDFAVGETAMVSHQDPKTAEAAFLKALDEDKFFTLAAEQLALLYAETNNAAGAAQYAENAYSGRQTMSERSRLEIEVVHAALVDKDQGEVQKALKALHATYPQDDAVNGLLKK